MQQVTFTEKHVKWSVTLADRLGPEILTVFEIEGRVLHRVRLRVKVPGWLSGLNELLTKKLPKFLPRLNEMSGGRENMCLFSGSLRRILIFFENDIFDSKVLRMVGKGEWNSVGSFVLPVKSVVQSLGGFLSSHCNTIDSFVVVVTK